MRYLKWRKKLPNNLPVLLQNLLFPLVWSFLIAHQIGNWFLFIPSFVFLIFGFYLSLKFFKIWDFLNNWSALTLNISLLGLVSLSYSLEVSDILNLKPYTEAYYLFVTGSFFGVLLKNFLRKKPVYIPLLFGTITLLFATFNVFVSIGFLFSNLVSADIYGKERDTYSEIKATAVGNAIFSTLLVGYWLQVEPTGFYKVFLYYPVSVIFGVFFLFGFQKLLDLLPFMYSDEKLEKLANISNPLIEEMMIRAPGTYHHSVMVALLAESLAKKVEADPLLVKVGAMFHDIGKLINPQYFIENVNGENPHKNLKPEVSAAIIKNHVEEGIVLAKKYKLPEEIVKFIPEHQGTKLIKYFYYKALEENPEVKKSKFQYRGPIPQSKETAIVMIADTVEAMVRALKNPTPEDIKKTVKKAIEMLKEEGQLEASELTEKELKKIEKTLVELIMSYYHERIKYPEKPKKESSVKLQN